MGGREGCGDEGRLSAQRARTFWMRKGDDEGASVFASALRQRQTGGVEKGHVEKVKAEDEEREAEWHNKPGRVRRKVRPLVLHFVLRELP